MKLAELSGTNQEPPKWHKPSPLCIVGKHARNLFMSSMRQNFKQNRLIIIAYVIFEHISLIAYAKKVMEISGICLFVNFMQKSPFGSS